MVYEVETGLENMISRRLFPESFLGPAKKAASLKNSNSMRWHPLFIRWCLYLDHLYGKGDETMRSASTNHRKEHYLEHSLYPPVSTKVSEMVKQQHTECLDDLKRNILATSSCGDVTSL